MTGLYLHIPFCSHRCGYCDFATWEGREAKIPAYLDAIEREASLVFDGEAPPWPNFDTVFVGGGTPTLLCGEHLERFFSFLRWLAPPETVAEGTIEANPESLTLDHLTQLPPWQRRRVSLGVQDFSAQGRAFLERGHDPDDVKRCVKLIRQVSRESDRPIELNLDLIIGWTGQTEVQFWSTLYQALSLKPDHLSVYLLTVEPATPLGRKVRGGSVKAPDAEMQADYYLMARETILEAGLQQYEISNFARSVDTVSLHNSLYWRGQNYLGLGVSASSHRDGHRWTNSRSLDAYISGINRGQPTLSDEERITAHDQLRERVWLGLRMTEGVAETQVRQLDARFQEQVQEYQRHGLVENLRGRWRLTPQGMLVSNELFVELV